VLQIVICAIVKTDPVRGVGTIGIPVVKPASSEVDHYVPCGPLIIRIGYTASVFPAGGGQDKINPSAAKAIK
jgi:hypothetical protein